MVKIERFIKWDFIIEFMEDIQLSPNGLVERINSELKPDNHVRVDLTETGSQYWLSVKGEEHQKGTLQPPMNPDEFNTFLRPKLRLGYGVGNFFYDIPNTSSERIAHLFIHPETVPQANARIAELQR